MLQKAIITTNIDGNPEVVEHQRNGLLVPVRDQEALEKALDELLKNPTQVKKYAKASREKYLKEFDFQKTIKEQLITILEGN